MARKTKIEQAITGYSSGTGDMDRLMLHYLRGRQDMDTRRTRKNGWNEILTAYMGRLPANWPFLTLVTDPRLRTAITEKTARLINNKLQGRLVPRNGGSVIKAKIQNALLNFQWDFAQEGGGMIEKTAFTDQVARLMGAGFALVYWDTVKNSNEIKVIDPRDLSFDGAATHVKNARWCQIREFTTWDKLEARGFKVDKLKKAAQDGEIADQWKSTSYESIVKANRGLMDRTGEPDNPLNPIVEVVTEWRPETPLEKEGAMDIFLPRFGRILESGDNPYEHGKIPLAQLRYYPLFDDIYGETDAEYVLPLQRAINANLCEFLDEMTISTRPPLKIASAGVRTETIEYGPGAQWIMDNPNMVQEMTFSPQAVANFNTTYPALVAAFNTAMGDSSLGISNSSAKFAPKTATEVNQLSTQQNSRDQNNQIYLSQFLEDIMMMWLSNNKQYLFDDPTKTHQILKIIGPENVKYFQAMGLGDQQVPPYVIDQVKSMVEQNPTLPPQAIEQIMQTAKTPTHPVVLNPKEKNPENYDIKPKLDIKENDEADLYLTEDDFEGEYDYIPDVTSMAAGATNMQQQTREEAIQLILNPAAQQIMMQQGVVPDIKEILINKFQDAGYTDAESLFKTTQEVGGSGGIGTPSQGSPTPPVPGQPQMGQPQLPQGMPQQQPQMPQQPMNQPMQPMQQSMMIPNSQ